MTSSNLLRSSQAQEDAPTRIDGTIEGLTPGSHGIHIHTFGDFSQVRFPLNVVLSKLRFRGALFSTFLFILQFPLSRVPTPTTKTLTYFAATCRASRRLAVFSTPLERTTGLRMTRSAWCDNKNCHEPLALFFGGERALLHPFVCCLLIDAGLVEPACSAWAAQVGSLGNVEVDATGRCTVRSAYALSTGSFPVLVF